MNVIFTCLKCLGILFCFCKFLLIYFLYLFGFLAGDHQKIDVFQIQHTLVKRGRIVNGCTALSELYFALFLSKEFRQLTKLLHEHFSSFYVTHE